jgi:predicted PurR-regulated permease PerM
MSYWLSAQLILALIIGAATFVALMILRIPYAVPLAMLATIGELVPVIGPIVGAVPSLIVALFQSRWQFWAVLAMAIVLQKTENLLLVPRLMSRHVMISPLVVFVAFMIGGSLLGILGAVLAIPIAAIAQVTFEEAFIIPRERRQGSSRRGALLRDDKRAR